MLGFLDWDGKAFAVLFNDDFVHYWACGYACVGFGVFDLLANQGVNSKVCKEFNEEGYVGVFLDEFPKVLGKFFLAHEKNFISFV